MIMRITRLVGAALLLSTPFAYGQSFNQVNVFGDSTVDSGYYKILPNPGASATYNSYWAAAVAAGAGAPTTNPGPMNSQILASYFGLSALPANQGGTDYATSGAKNVTVNDAQTGGFKAAIPTTIQIANYLAANGGSANPNALYLISSGGNDVSYAIGATGTGPFPPNQSAQSAYVISAADSLASSITSLQTAGARYIIVPDLPYSFPTGAANANERRLRLLYVQTLWSSLSADGVQFIPADLNAFRLAVASNPAEFGFISISNAVGHTACTDPAGVTTAWALLCSANPSAPSHLVAPNAEQTFLFADDQHYTTAGQKIEADYYYSLLTAPGEISYLAETPVKTRAVVITAIDNQIPISLVQPGPYHAWVSGDVSWLKINNPNNGFPDDPGTPASGTAGFDFRIAPNWLLGAAFSGGRTTQSFSLGGGFSLDEFAVSTYAAYRNSRFWGNAIASAGGLFFNTNRQVPIGITTQSNTSSAKGSNFSLMLETGYDFTSLLAAFAPVMPVKATPAIALTHGPVVGVTLQQVRIGGFTETDQFASIGGFTALSFLGQIRDSAVAELGYQASTDIGVWHPFGKLVWNHELVDPNRDVTAFLTSVSFAPGYSLPAVMLGANWGTATLGTSIKLSSNVTGVATFISQFAQESVTTYGGQVGVNVAF